MVDSANVVTGFEFPHHKITEKRRGAPCGISLPVTIFASATHFCHRLGCDALESVTTAPLQHPRRTYSGVAMKANALQFTSRIVAGLLSLSMAQAADAVRWNDLPNKIGHGKMRSDDREDRQYRIITKDGLTHVGYALIFS